MDYNNYFDFLLKKTNNPQHLFLLRSYRKKISHDNININEINLDLSSKISNYLDWYNEYMKLNTINNDTKINIIKLTREERIKLIREERIKKFNLNDSKKNSLISGFQQVFDQNTNFRKLF